MPNEVPSGQTTHTLEEIDAAVDAVYGKQDALTWDSDPTSGSSNPVTSGGIYNAIFVTSAEIATGTDLNDLGAGKYIASDAAAAGISNRPAYDGGFTLIAENIGEEMMQTLIALDGTRLFIRATISGTWSTWTQFNTSALLWGQGIPIPEGADLNDYGETYGIGMYYSSNSARTKTLDHRPFSGAGFKLEVVSISTTNKQQRLYPISSGAAASGFYIRSRTTSGWASWYWIAGSASPDIIEYTLLSSQPSDWSSAYHTKYYIWDPDNRVYTKIPQGSSAPVFVTGTYYSKTTA